MGLENHEVTFSNSGATLLGAPMNLVTAPKLVFALSRLTMGRMEQVKGRFRGLQPRGIHL